MVDSVRSLQRDIVNGYADAIGLPVKAAYISGAPLRPLPPLDTNSGGLMILGAYPSARFATIDGIRDVPVGDNLGPFESERYFDGDRLRKQASADELNSHILEPLGVSRERCWVTDLVKVFLFKSGHRDKYAALGASVPKGHHRESFEQLGLRSMPWLAREIRLSKPALLLTLGSEVAGLVRGVVGQKARNALLGSDITDVVVDGTSVRTVHLVHPGILMRGGGGRNPWPAATTEHIQALRPRIIELGLTARNAGASQSVATNP
jgi:uracil-DNA glycosylase